MKEVYFDQEKFGVTGKHRPACANINSWYRAPMCFWLCSFIASKIPVGHDEVDL